MGRVLRSVMMGLFAIGALAPAARADTTVRVLETYPTGETVTLAPNQNFYLRLHYETDRPTRIWARPYFEGRPVAAGSNPSPSYDGSGEALGWFFFMRPQDQVDEIRIEAGDGSTAGTHPVATYPIRITADAALKSAAPAPAWVSDLSRRAQAAQRTASENAANGATSAQETSWLAGFVLLACLIALFGLVAPAWALLRWHGGWRVAAAVPATLMLFVVLRIVAGVAHDPTSHNLWPFEILQSGALSGIVMIVLGVVRRLRGAART